ncbi:MAG: hypothetical protein KDB64_00575, partial [Solirubrobacterales bacterium]|nr:hypothetical protein [Solirubrobacterales bacterium]
KVNFRGKRRVVVLARGGFKAAAGKTDTIIIRLSSAQRRLLHRVRAARNLKLTAEAKDKAGNKARITIRIKAVLP